MSFNAKDMTQGGQIASMRIRMFSQIANIMLYPGKSAAGASAADGAGYGP